MKTEELLRHSSAYGRTVVQHKISDNENPMIIKSTTHLIQFLVIVSTMGCFGKANKTFVTSTKELCSCFKGSTILGIDGKLDDCIKPFNKFINDLHQSNQDSEEIPNVAKEGLLTIVNELTKRCPSYREAFLKVAVNKFGNIPKPEAESLIAQFENSPKDEIVTLKLVNSYLSISASGKVDSLLNIFISEKPNSDYAYWMKSYNYYQNGKLSKAIEAIDSAIYVSKNEQTKTALGYYKNIINPIVTDGNEEIMIKYTKNQ